MFDSLGQREGLARAIGSDDEHRREVDGEGGGDGQYSLLLLGIQTGIQLLIPLPVAPEEELTRATNARMRPANAAATHRDRDVCE